MSLDFDLKGIKDYRNTCNHLDEDGVFIARKALTETLIWATIPAGIGHITEANALKFWTRMYLLDKLDGKRLNVKITSDDGKHSELVRRSVTLEEVQSHIGLRTNVHTESDAKWRKRILDGFFRDSEQKAERQATSVKRQMELAEQRVESGKVVKA